MKLKVEFEIDIQEDVTLEQAVEWLLFRLGERNSMSADHPMDDTDMNARRTVVRRI